MNQLYFEPKLTHLRLTIVYVEFCLFLTHVVSILLNLGFLNTLSVQLFLYLNTLFSIDVKCISIFLQTLSLDVELALCK